MKKAIIGIYKITNTINNKVYIGSSKDILKRWNSHVSMLRNNKHHSIHLQRSWNKYGEDNFDFEILEIIRDENKLLSAEQEYIDKCKSYDYKYGYNIAKEAGIPSKPTFDYFGHLVTKQGLKMNIHKMDITLPVLGLYYSMRELVDDNNMIVFPEDKEKPMGIGDISEYFEVDRKTISVNTQILENKNLIRTVKDGKCKYIYVNPYYYMASSKIDESVFEMFN